MRVLTGQVFWLFFWQILDSLWGLFSDQIGPRGAKMGPTWPSRAPKSRKPAFAKTLKNMLFFNVFGVQGRRKPQKAQEDTQEVPEELQTLTKQKKRTNT